MYEKVISKWFEKRKTPNHQFSIVDITALLLGYDDESFHIKAIERKAVQVIKDLKKCGFDKTSKTFTFGNGTHLPCYFNISFKKIKNIIKPFSREGYIEMEGYMHFRRGMHRIGWILGMYDKGFEIKKKINKKNEDT